MFPVAGGQYVECGQDGGYVVAVDAGHPPSESAPFVFQRLLVDLIADPTTIICGRLAWADFSTDYLDAYQRVLVPSASTARGIGDLGGQKVCAAAGTTSIRAVRDLDNSGDYPDAVYLAIGSGTAASPDVIQQREAALAKQAGPGHPTTSASAFQDVESDLTAGISADHASFTASASRGDDALGGLTAGMIIASLLMAAGCTWGLARRIAEYR